MAEAPRDVALVRAIAQEIDKDGGVGHAHRLVTPSTRKLLGDRRLVPFMREREQYFNIIEDGQNGGLCRVAMAECWASSLSANETTITAPTPSKESAELPFVCDGCQSRYPSR